MYSGSSVLSVSFDSILSFVFSTMFNFRRSCVRTHIDVCFKEGKCRFACVETSCPGEYSMPLVNELLPPKDLNRLNRRIQEENIRQGKKIIVFISKFEVSF